MTAERSRLPQDAAGLVLALDVTGRMLGVLEDRVALLEDALAAERRERSRAEDLLAQLRATFDTGDVDPSSPVGAQNVGYDRPAATT